MEISTIIIVLLLVFGLLGLIYLILKGKGENLINTPKNSQTVPNPQPATLVKEKVIKPQSKSKNLVAKQVVEPKIEKTVVVESKNSKRRKSK
jgi:hypothetical protein